MHHGDGEYETDSAGPRGANADFDAQAQSGAEAEAGAPSDTNATKRASGTKHAEARGFSRGLGFILQGLGAAMLLFMTCTCCGVAFIEAGVWQTSGEAEAVERDAEGRPTGTLKPPSPRDAARKRAYAVLLVGSAVGAFAMIGFGVGMQADRGRPAAVGSAATCTAMIGVYGWASWSLWSIGAPTMIVGLSVILTAILFLLAGAAWAAMVEVFRHPPRAADVPSVPAEAFPDPWAGESSSASGGAPGEPDRPVRASIAKERERLRRQLEALDEIEEKLESGEGSSDVLSREDGTTGNDESNR